DQRDEAPDALGAVAASSRSAASCSVSTVSFPRRSHLESRAVGYVEELRRVVGHRKLIMAGVRAVIRDEAGRVLLQKRGDFGTWGLPAGSMELDESIWDTLCREVYEETRL